MAPTSPFRLLVLDDFVEAPPSPKGVPHQLRRTLAATGHEAAQAAERLFTVRILLEEGEQPLTYSQRAKKLHI